MPWGVRGVASWVCPGCFAVPHTLRDNVIHYEDFAT